jgi:hypothetical protein
METWISHNGEAPISELEPLPVYDSLRGQQVQRRWVGSIDRIKAKYNEILAGGGAQTVRISDALNGMGLQLTADYAGVFNPATGGIDTTASVILTEWTSEPTVITQSLWALPAIALEFQKLGTSEVGLSNARRIRTYIDALVRGETIVPDPTDPKGVKTLPISATILLALVSQVGLSVEVFSPFLFELLRGVTSYSPSSWNLRRTRRIPAAVPFMESDVNVGRMLTMGGLLSEGFGTDLLRSKIPSHGYWHKQHPADRPVGDGFREVTTDYYWSESYSQFIYGTPVTG